jgi:hypothetical protein
MPPPDFSETDFGKFFLPTPARTRLAFFLFETQTDEGCQIGVGGTTTPGDLDFNCPISRSATPPSSNATAAWHI